VGDTPLLALKLQTTTGETSLVLPQGAHRPADILRTTKIRLTQQLKYQPPGLYIKPIPQNGVIQKGVPLTLKNLKGVSVWRGELNSRHRRYKSPPDIDLGSNKGVLPQEVLLDLHNNITRVRTRMEKENPLREPHQTLSELAILEIKRAVLTTPARNQGELYLLLQKLVEASTDLAINSFGIGRAVEILTQTQKSITDLIPKPEETQH